MLKIAVTAAALALTSSAAFATYTVYQGSPKSGKVLGTFDTKAEVRQFLKEHPGYGESVVNNTNGREAKVPGRNGWQRAREKNHKSQARDSRN